MANILERLEAPLMRVAGKLGQQPHLNAIRDGVVAALPLVLIGSLFMLVYQPPLSSQAAVAAYTTIPWVHQIPVALTVLMKLIAIFVAFGIAHSLAKRYDLDSLSAGLLAVAALILVNMPRIDTVGLVVPAGYMPITNLGAGGLFMGIILGLLVPEVQRLARKQKLEVRLPDGVPPAVGRSFSALIPGLLILVPLWLIVHVFGLDLFHWMGVYLTDPLTRLSESSVSLYPVLLLIIVIDSILWLLGVHAVAILAPVKAIWIANILENASGVGHHLNTTETLQFFIWIGGSGATMVLPFLLLKAKSASLRAIAKIGAIPALFNINEPLIFGVPVVMNATLAVPFLLAPIVMLTTTVLVMQAGLVPIPHIPTPWTLPGPIGAFLATGGAWQAAVLSLVNIALAALIYWPFVRALDKKMAEGEAGGG